MFQYSSILKGSSVYQPLNLLFKLRTKDFHSSKGSPLDVRAVVGIGYGFSSLKGFLYFLKGESYSSKSYSS